MIRKILIFYSYLFVSFAVDSDVLDQKLPSAYDNYRVAVVQYRAATESDPDVKILSDAVRKNVANYIKIIEDAKAGISTGFFGNKGSLNNVTIIVFPEYGLTVLPNSSNKNFSTFAKRFVYKEPEEEEDSTKQQQLKSREMKEDYKIIKQIRSKLASVASVIPSPEEKISPCDDNTTYSQALRRISCAARNNSMYVVINLIEKVQCKSYHCARHLDDFLLHNTNVVFDRNGTVIARYRKFYIHHEPWLDKISNPDVSIFTTDFNVTFAQLIGIDILRKGPTKKIFDFENITDIIYSTHRWDDFWLLNTKHDLYRWAYEYNADLMISGSTKDGGSDLVAGRDGPIYTLSFTNKDSYFYRGDFSRRRVRRDCITDKHFRVTEISEVRSGLLVTTEPVPNPSIWLIDDNNSSFTDFFNQGLMNSLLLDMTNSTRSDHLCIKDFCCYFEYHTTFNETEYKLNNSVHYRHRLTVFKTFYEFYDKSIVGIEVCALIACTSDRVEDCGKKLNHPKGVTLSEPLRINTMVITRYMVPDSNSYAAPLASRKSEKKHLEYLAKQGEQFTFIKSGSHYSTLLVLTLDEPEDDLTFFGINVRIFDVTNVWESIKPPVPACGSNYTLIFVWIAIIALLIGVMTIVYLARYWLRGQFDRITRRNQES